MFLLDNLFFAQLPQVECVYFRVFKRRIFLLTVSFVSVPFEESATGDDTESAYLSSDLWCKNCAIQFSTCWNLVASLSLDDLPF